MQISDIFTKNGKIVGPRLTNIMMSPEGEKIKSETSFLSTNASPTERIYCILHGIENVPNCQCGNAVKFIGFAEGYQKSCSNKCAANIKTRQDKRINKRKEIYGIGEKLIVEKREKTTLERHGAKCILSFGEVRQKANHDHKKMQQARNVTIREKNKNFVLLDSKQWCVEMYKKYTITQLSEIMGISSVTVTNYFESHNIDRVNWINRSGIEQEIADYVKSLSVQLVLNSREIIPPKEIDIYIPSHKLAIEVDGVFWHSTFSVEDDSLRKHIHLHKTKECEANGISILHIFDTEWEAKKDIWKSVILAKLGMSKRIYARKCEFSKIESSVGRKFMEDNHLQGSTTSGEYYGLILENTPVAVMQVAKSRFKSTEDHEILRYCSVLGHSVVGGFSKILKHIPHVGTIKSYANRRWSSGELYKASGFTFVNETKPNYWYWINQTELKNRISFQKHKLNKMLDKYNDMMSESENMFENGYRKLYDCGNLVFSLHKY